MRKKDIYTLGLLIVLTIITALFSNNFGNFNYIILTILFLFSIKFLLVVFNFMELKYAHSLWKSLIIMFLIIFVGIITIIL
ncbi:MAG: cytochrome C oxidase subunit IV family protein [Flavobacteriaceae bacterium]|nr:cytochrome C oxidase subunit IV family protein [Flavobacteriaceae bacterium]